MLTLIDRSIDPLEAPLWFSCSTGPGLWDSFGSVVQDLGGLSACVYVRIDCSTCATRNRKGKGRVCSLISSEVVAVAAVEKEKENSVWNK